MTTIITTKIGESKSVARIWLEGSKLRRAGVKVGSTYEMVVNKEQQRLDLREVNNLPTGKTFVVSKRERRGKVVPLMEVRTKELRHVFEKIERVRVAIRAGRITVTAHHLETKIRERVKRAVDKLRAGNELAVASLFHGGGVVDRALHSGLRRSGVGSFVLSYPDN